MGSAIQPARGDGENSPSSSLWGLEGWTEGSLGSTESRIRGSLYPEPPSSPQGLPSHPQVEGALVELGGWEEVEGQLQSRGGCLGDCGVGGEGAFCIPLYVPYVLTGRWPFSRGLCKLWLVVDYLLCTSSVFNIVLISYDRFLSVTHAVSYRAQQGDTRRAAWKMVLVWVLAFLLYGPAILSWEYLSGRSSIPEGQCYAEFFYNWYFLITASTLEFFTPFLSVTFFNLSIYLNIQRRTRGRLDGAREAAGLEPAPEAQPSSPPVPGCWGCWQKGRGEAVPLHRCGVGEVVPGPEAGEAALGGSGGGTVGSPTSSSGSSSRGTERPRSLKRGSKPSASSASLEKRMKMVSQSITQRFRLSRDKKVAKSLAVIVSIFGLCWAPYTLLMIIRAACHGRCVPDYWLKAQPHSSLEHGWK